MKSIRHLTIMAMLAVTSSAISLSASAAVWNGYNNPANLKKPMNYQFNQLPTAVKLRGPWSDTYWPTNNAGISARWYRYSGSREGNFTYGSPSKEQLAVMSDDQKALLSPAEKYDILMGRYDYPTVSSERARTSYDADSWNGICHGWSPAALNHAEPQPKTMINADGITVPFGSSDIKALLSYYYGVVYFQTARNSNMVHQVGKRSAGIRGDDVNPGALHVILANLVGLQRQGFISDIDAGEEVWNQPIIGFKFINLGDVKVWPHHRWAGIYQRIRMQVVMTYVSEINPRWEPVVGTAVQQELNKVYTYILELGGSGNIVGGAWESNDHPDFLWTHDVAPFQGYFSNIQQLLVQN